MEIFMSDTEIKEQQPAPDFTLPAVGNDDVVKNGQVHLQDLKGRTIVLYFYPKDDTSGCTKEACSFRDNLARVRKKGTELFGISADSVESHEKFSQKYSLNFPLLSDESKTVVKAYGVWKEKSMYGRKYM